MAEGLARHGVLEEAGVAEDVRDAAGAVESVGRAAVTAAVLVGGVLDGVGGGDGAADGVGGLARGNDVALVNGSLGTAVAVGAGFGTRGAASEEGEDNAEEKAEEEHSRFAYRKWACWAREQGESALRKGGGFARAETEGAGGAAKKAAGLGRRQRKGRRRTIDATKGGEDVPEVGGGDGLVKAGTSQGQAGLPEAPSAGGIGQQRSQRGSERGGVALGGKEPGLAREDHFGNTGDAGGNAGEGGGHGFHENGGQDVAAAGGFGDAGKDEESGLGQEVDDVGLGQGAGEGDVLLELGGGDARLKIGFEGAVANDAALEREGSVAEQGAGVDEIGEAFFFDEAADGEEQGRGSGGRRRRLEERGEVEAVVDAVNAGGGGGVMLAEPGGGVVADGDDGGGVGDEAGELEVAGVVGAKEVVGVAGEAVAEAVGLADPPGGAGGEAGEVSVDVVHLGGAEFVPDPSGFVEAGFVGSGTPVAEGEDEGLREEALLF